MSYELFNYELQIINFKVQTSKFKEYSIACNAFAGANIKAKEIRYIRLSVILGLFTRSKKLLAAHRLSTLRVLAASK